MQLGKMLITSFLPKFCCNLHSYALERLFNPTYPAFPVRVDNATLTLYANHIWNGYDDDHELTGPDNDL